MTNYNERLDEILATIVDDNKLRSHRRVPPGTCSCGFNAYSVKGIMLDYGDILRAHIDDCIKKVKAHEAIVEEAKQSLTSLIKELVAEAKPSKKHVGDEVAENRSYTGERLFNATIDEYHTNILKALEEV